MLKRTFIGPRRPEPIDFDGETEAGLAEVAEFMALDRRSVIDLIIKDWLITQGYLPALVMDEKSETLGSA